MKIVYAGTPLFAVEPLKTLIEKGHDIVAVVTQRDKPVGRKGVLTPPPVKVYAEEAGLPVFQPDKIGDHVNELKGLGADVMFTCAYGQILTEPVLKCFPEGVWNIHFSLLPKYRGASPVQAAMLGMERYTGITVMKTELKLDSGDMLLVKRCGILPGETCGELTDRLAMLAAQAAPEAAEMIERGDISLLLQDEGAATYCKKIKKEDARVDFSASVEEVCALINAMSPAPAAYSLLNGKAVNFYRAYPANEECAGSRCGEVSDVRKDGFYVRCGDGCVRISEAQFSGGKRLGAKDLYNGGKPAKGDLFE